LLFAGSPAAAAPVTHEYTVSVDRSLTRLNVAARFAHPVDKVSARSRDAAKFLLDAVDCENGGDITTRSRRLAVPEQGLACVDYTVDLQRAAGEHRYGQLLAKDNIIVSPAYWMWRPDVNDETRIRVEFRLPDGIRVSVPWHGLTPGEAVYELSVSPESAYAPAVFGDFDYRELEVPGATLRVTLVRGAETMENDAIAHWIGATATDVSLAYGRFPSPSPQVVVIPVGGSRRNSRSAVPFGRVIRDGGETVELQVDQSQPLAALLGDWTATHEFSHLLLPYVERSHRWISEGFAQYYQNVLLTRSGAYDAEYAWQKIHDGYERGRRSRPDLSPNGASSGRVRSGLMKVYWSGAALALIADVQLRERSGGEASLDDVLEKFQACCLPSSRVWKGPELFAKFDELAGAAVFTPLYAQYADTVGFPDTGAVLERLGVTVSDGKVGFAEHAELRGIRESILETDPVTAGWRQALSAY
jgi:hypothetical protein